MVFFDYTVVITLTDNAYNISNRLKQAIEQSNLSYVELEKKTGIAKSSIQRYASGTTKKIPVDAVSAIAKAVGVSDAWIMGWDKKSNTDQSAEFDFSALGLSPLPKTIQKPRLGVIACGEPLLTEENFDGFDDVPIDVKCDFTLKCKGDSMINARINDGDIVYIKCQPTVENGQIAAVMVNGETTLKRVFIYENKVVLQAENPRYEPFIYVNEELNNIRILGKAVGFYSNL